MATLFFAIGIIGISIMAGVYQNLLAVQIAIFWLAFIVEGKK